MMVTGRTGIVNAPSPAAGGPVGRWIMSLSVAVTAPAVTVQSTIVSSQTLTRRESCPAGAESLTPGTLALHPVEALATENRSSTGASATTGAGMKVSVRCHVLSMVTESHRSPMNCGGGLTG